jgi:glycosyltransferase involved in cell wall biosynthesis
MTGPSISVALATFDGARYVTAQLRSILEQSRRPDEVVVSDGGSTDGTVRIVREVLADHPEVSSRVIADGSRLGVSANFARALAATGGDLIALSDQDDVWHPDRLRRGMDGLTSDDRTLLAHSDARLIDADGVELGTGLFAALGVGARERAQLAGDDAFALLVRRNVVTGATVVMRRRLLELAEPFPGSWVHDEWLAALAAAFGRIAPSDERLIDYRQHGTNAIGVSNPTFGYRVHRMLEARGERYVRLATRAAALQERLDLLEAPDRWRELARLKAEFEEDRSHYARARVARLRPILRHARRGDYRLLSSQGDLDVLRDFLQPA